MKNNTRTKDYFIKKIAINKVISDKMISEKVINKVITHQFDSANDAIMRCNSVEFSGFGKFLFNVEKAKKKMRQIENTIQKYSMILEDETISPTIRRNAEMKLASAIDTRIKLKPKIDHGSESNI
jgi:nucleoid DNA-binding protein